MAEFDNVFEAHSVFRICVREGAVSLFDGLGGGEHIALDAAVFASGSYFELFEGKHLGYSEVTEQFFQALLSVAYLNGETGFFRLECEHGQNPHKGAVHGGALFHVELERGKLRRAVSEVAQGHGVFKVCSSRDRNDITTAAV